VIAKRAHLAAPPHEDVESIMDPDGVERVARAVGRRDEAIVYGEDYVTALEAELAHPRQRDETKTDDRVFLDDRLEQNAAVAIADDGIDDAPLHDELVASHAKDARSGMRDRRERDRAIEALEPHEQAHADEDRGRCHRDAARHPARDVHDGGPWAPSAKRALGRGKLADRACALLDHRVEIAQLAIERRTSGSNRLHRVAIRAADRTSRIGAALGRAVVVPRAARCVLAVIRVHARTSALAVPRDQGKRTRTMRGQYASGLRMRRSSWSALVVPIE